MSEDIWVVAGQPKGTPPVVGQEYEVHCSRKGTFNAKVLEVGGPFATLEVTQGKPQFISLDYKLNYNGIVSVRASLAYFIPLEPDNTASSGLVDGLGEKPAKVTKSKKVAPAVSR